MTLYGSAIKKFLTIAIDVFRWVGYVYAIGSKFINPSTKKM